VVHGELGGVDDVPSRGGEGKAQQGFFAADEELRFEITKSRNAFRRITQASARKPMRAGPGRQSAGRKLLAMRARVGPAFVADDHACRSEGRIGLEKLCGSRQGAWRHQVSSSQNAP